MNITQQSPFGKPIKFESVKKAKKQTQPPGCSPANQIGANTMISQFLNLKQSYHARLQEMTTGDANAKRYFCGGDCAYIFDVAFLEAIIHVVNGTKPPQIPVPNESKGCMVLFQGLRKDNSQGKAKKGNASSAWAFGRPTLIATAFKYDDSGNLKHQPIPQKFLPSEIQILDDGDPDGIEHPGDGSGSGSGLVNSEEWIPKVVDKAGDEDDTDYVILTKITKETLSLW